MSKREPKGIYRRYIPHWDTPGLYQGVTFRLADSLPKQALDEWKDSLSANLNDIQRARVERLVNAGRGACWLRDPRFAVIVEDALLHYDGDRYQMVAWVIMLNHVHALLKMEQGFSLPAVVSSWKGFTAKLINKELKRHGTF